VVLSLALSASPATGEAPGTVVEAVVAVLRNPASAAPRPITLSRLEEEARVALVDRGAVEAATAPLDRAALSAALRWTVDQLLVADEAARLRLDEAPRDELLAALRRFKARFAGEAAWLDFLARTELTEEEVTALLARRLRVERYLASRVGRAARVGEAEVDGWLAERGAAGAGASARAAARAEIARERAEAQSVQLLSDLRARADLRVVLPGLEGAAPAGAAP
jgi:hypothetical protein